MFKLLARIVISVLALTNSCLAQSLPDPLMLRETNIRSLHLGGSGNRDTSSKVLSSQTVNPAQRTLVLIAAGQSNMTNMAPTPYVPTNPTALDNLNIYDGAIYKASDPVLGTDGGVVWSTLPYMSCVCLRVADALVSSGRFDRIILVPVALGGSAINLWSTGVLSSRIPIALRRIAQRGITPGPNVTFAIMWGQGESDTALATSQADYVTAFNTMFAKAAAAGFTGRWFVARETYNLGAFSSAVQAAQTAQSPAGVINNAAGVFAGPNADALVGNICGGSYPCRIADKTHFTDIGSAAYATDRAYGWLQAMHASGAPF